jgi:hypothetical protein
LSDGENAETNAVTLEAPLVVVDMFAAVKNKNMNMRLLLVTEVQVVLLALAELIPNKSWNAHVKTNVKANATASTGRSMHTSSGIVVMAVAINNK